MSHPPGTLIAVTSDGDFYDREFLAPGETVRYRWLQQKLARTKRDSRNGAKARARTPRLMGRATDRRDLDQLYAERDQLRSDCHKWVDLVASTERVRQIQAADADQYEAGLRDRAEKAERAVDHLAARTREAVAARDTAEARANRYRTAWQSAAERAVAYGEGILRLCDDRDSYAGWLEQEQGATAALRARIAELEHQITIDTQVMEKADGIIDALRVRQISTCHLSDQREAEVMTHHCCEAMTSRVNVRCDQHDDPFACPDALVDFSAKFQEYGLIIHDGGTSSITIDFCPWCGRRLPESQRDRWFGELERRGIDPWEDEVPAEFQDDRWLAALHQE